MTTVRREPGDDDPVAIQRTGVLLALLCLATACDRFFTVEARVTSCRSGTPVNGAEAVLKLDKGFGEPDLTRRTDSEGRLRMVLNEPPEAWATLTVTAPGHGQWRQQFRGQPAPGLAICLVPSGPKPVGTP